jgi:hypothetical protein
MSFVQQSFATSYEAFAQRAMVVDSISIVSAAVIDTISTDDCATISSVAIIDASSASTLST